MAESNLLRQLMLIFVLCFCTSVSADVLDEILERGTIRVGVAEFVPWTHKNKAGELVGFEIDVARKIAGDMSVEPEFKVYLWEDIIPALLTGEIDIIAGGMSITPARALKVDFSRPLAESGVGLATNTRMTRNIESLRELDAPGIVVTTVKDTIAVTWRRRCSRAPTSRCSRLEAKRNLKFSKGVRMSISPAWRRRSSWSSSTPMSSTCRSQSR